MNGIERISNVVIEKTNMSKQRKAYQLNNIENKRIKLNDSAEERIDDNTTGRYIETANSVSEDTPRTKQIFDENRKVKPFNRPTHPTDNLSLDDILNSCSEKDVSYTAVNLPRAGTSQACKASTVIGLVRPSTTVGSSASSSTTTVSSSTSNVCPSAGLETIDQNEFWLCGQNPTDTLSDGSCKQSDKTIDISRKTREIRGVKTNEKVEAQQEDITQLENGITETIESINSFIQGTSKEPELAPNSYRIAPSDTKPSYQPTMVGVVEPRVVLKIKLAGETTPPKFNSNFNPSTEKLLNFHSDYDTEEEEEEKECYSTSSAKKIRKEKKKKKKRKKHKKNKICKCDTGFNDEVSLAQPSNAQNATPDKTRVICDESGVDKQRNRDETFRTEMIRNCYSEGENPLTYDTDSSHDNTSKKAIECANSKFGDFTSVKDEGSVFKMKDYWRHKSMMSPKKLSPPRSSNCSKSARFFKEGQVLPNERNEINEPSCTEKGNFKTNCLSRFSNLTQLNGGISFEKKTVSSLPEAILEQKEIVKRPHSLPDISKEEFKDTFKKSFIVATDTDESKRKAKIITSSRLRNENIEKRMNMLKNKGVILQDLTLHQQLLTNIDESENGRTKIKKTESENKSSNVIYEKETTDQNDEPNNDDGDRAIRSKNIHQDNNYLDMGTTGNKISPVFSDDQHAYNDGYDHCDTESRTNTAVDIQSSFNLRKDPSSREEVNETNAFKDLNIQNKQHQKESKNITRTCQNQANVASLFNNASTHDMSDERLKTLDETTNNKREEKNESRLNIHEDGEEEKRKKDMDNIKDKLSKKYSNIVLSTYSYQHLTTSQRKTLTSPACVAINSKSKNVADAAIIIRKRNFKTIKITNIFVKQAIINTIATMSKETSKELSKPVQSVCDCGMMNVEDESGHSFNCDSLKTHEDSYKATNLENNKEGKVPDYKQSGHLTNACNAVKNPASAEYDHYENAKINSRTKLSLTLNKSGIEYNPIRKSFGEVCNKFVTKDCYVKLKRLDLKNDMEDVGLKAAFISDDESVNKIINKKHCETKTESAKKSIRNNKERYREKREECLNRMPLQSNTYELQSKVDEQKVREFSNSPKPISNTLRRAHTEGYSHMGTSKMGTKKKEASVKGTTILNYDVENEPTDSPMYKVQGKNNDFSPAMETETSKFLISTYAEECLQQADNSNHDIEKLVATTKISSGEFLAKVVYSDEIESNTSTRPMAAIEGCESLIQLQKNGSAPTSNNSNEVGVALPVMKPGTMGASLNSKTKNTVLNTSEPVIEEASITIHGQEAPIELPEGIQSTDGIKRRSSLEDNTKHKGVNLNQLQKAKESQKDHESELTSMKIDYTLKVS